MLYYLKFKILQCIHFFHLIHILLRLHQNKPDVWSDKSDWIVQMVDTTVTVREIKEEFPDDNQAVNILFTLVNTEIKELDKRNLTSFYML